MDLGISQLHLATKSNLSTQTVSKAENEVPISERTARKIFHSLKVFQGRRRPALRFDELFWEVAPKRDHWRQPRSYPKSDIQLNWTRGKLGLGRSSRSQNPPLEKKYAHGAEIVADKLLELLRQTNIHPAVLELMQLYQSEIKKSERNIFALDNIARIIRGYFLQLGEEFSSFESESLKQFLISHQRLCLLFPDFIQMQTDFEASKIRKRLSTADLEEIRLLISDQPASQIISADVPPAITRIDADDLSDGLAHTPPRVEGESKLQSYKSVARVLELWNKLVNAPDDVRRKIDAWEALVEKLWRIVKTMLNWM